MAIFFEKTNNELILCYAPSMGIDDFLERLSKGEEILIKHTFNVNEELLRESDEWDIEETLRFCIGKVKEDYTYILPEIIGTKHTFFFSNEINLKYDMFVAYRNISILSKIDHVVNRDVYVGGQWEEKDGMPYEAYQQMLRQFPKTRELNLYAHQRIANCVKEYFQESEEYNVKFEKYLAKVSKRKSNKLYEKNIDIELRQFIDAQEELKELLTCAEGYDEKVWQNKIHGIICLLYPQYILAAREIRFQGIDGYDRQPDFVLVDTNGFIDFLEIKKPAVQILTKQASYRNNYVPVREFSGAVQQIEKYIFCLNSNENSRELVKKKLAPMLPKEVTPKILNPKGILLAGRSADFNTQQLNDYELIKRQYKSIVDIMTYDDLMNRLENIVSGLEMRKNML